MSMNIYSRSSSTISAHTHPVKSSSNISSNSMFNMSAVTLELVLLCCPPILRLNDVHLTFIFPYNNTLCYLDKSQHYGIYLFFSPRFTTDPFSSSMKVCGMLIVFEAFPVCLPVFFSLHFLLCCSYLSTANSS